MKTLTLKQKAELLEGADTWHTHSFTSPPIGAIRLSDGPNGLRVQAGIGDHLGLADSLPATCFPPAVALSSTWNPSLMVEVGSALATEAHHFGVNVLLGPGINIKRSPLCGRNFEYFSEDPLLTADLAGALVQGIQARGVAACLKHFAVNNQETARLVVSAEVDERTLREIYFYAFERIVRRDNPWTIMTAYNRINGTYASNDAWMLNTVLRDEWGYQGVVVSDWGAITDRVSALKAGVDLEMPGTGGKSARVLTNAVESGEISESLLDLSVNRLVRLGAQARTTPSDGDFEAHRAIARKAATESIVLLKNAANVLPLNLHADQRIAVVGQMAVEPRFQGAGSSQVVPTTLSAAFDAIEKRAENSGASVSFSPGYKDDADVEQAEQLRASAVACVKEAEVAIVFVGLPASYESEGYDRDSLQIPQSHRQLLADLHETGTPIVAVYSGGSVVTTEWDEDVDALLMGWLLGQEGGEATAAVLFGEADASGRLTETIPLRLEDTAAFGNFPGDGEQVWYGERGLVGYRWFDTRKWDVAYPFGFGLSYANFEYSDLDVAMDDTEPNTVRVSFTVTNVGERAGSTVAQLYVHQHSSQVQQPFQQLRGFEKIVLPPNESQRVEMSLDARDFSWWNTDLHAWVMEEGDFEIRIGTSSRDICLTQTVLLPGTLEQAPLTGDSTAEEWLANPTWGPRLRGLLEGTNYESVLRDNPEGKMLRAIPFARIAEYPGMPTAVAELLDQIESEQTE